MNVTDSKKVRVVLPMCLTKDSFFVNLADLLSIKQMSISVYISLHQIWTGKRFSNSKIIKTSLTLKRAMTNGPLV